MRNRIVIASLTTLGLLAAAPAFAKDLCFYEGASLRLVARPWKAPKPGKCRPFTGTGGGSGNGMASGTVCLSKDGAILRFGIAVQHQGALFANPYTDQISMGMDYETLMSSGANVMTTTFGETAVGTDSWGGIHAETCVGPDIN
jgi:hypothetical protein